MSNLNGSEKRTGEGPITSPPEGAPHKYILNSAVITAPGLYFYHIVTPEEARKWYGDGVDVVSTIGYEETAQALSQLLGRPVPVNRVTIKMQPDDEALVFRLVLPPSTQRIDPKDKGAIAQHVQAGHWELGLLRRVRSDEACDYGWTTEVEA
jgi:hypothetical protein